LALAFALVTSVIVSALAQQVPVRADPPGDPDMRLQVVIKSVHLIKDDEEHSAGRLRLTSALCPATNGGLPREPLPCPDGDHINWSDLFNASVGDDVTIERAAPRAGDTIAADATPDAGLSVYAGQQFVFLTELWDRTTPEYGVATPLGFTAVMVDEAHNWGIGTFTMRSKPTDESEGEYEVTFEIRQTPLPDLQVYNFQVAGLPGSGQYDCGQIYNSGQKASGPVPLTLRTEGVVLETTTLDTIDAGDSTWHCILRSDLPARKHFLVFSVDEARQVPEIYEYNNVAVMTVEADPSGTANAQPVVPTPATAPTTAVPTAIPTAIPSPQPKPTETRPKPGADLPDMIVMAFKVNGRDPDGRNDCKVGKNSVTVGVKNEGTGDAGKFVVRLTVDGDDRNETIDKLGAGRTREVRFDNIRLEKGRHPFEMLADAEQTLAEANDDNNGLRVILDCSDAG
jgi:hypothetical protein